MAELGRALDQRSRDRPARAMATVTLSLARFTEADRSAWLQGAISLLTDAERERVAAMPSPDARALHAIGRASLRLLGAQVSQRGPQEITVAVSEAGKPHLPELPDLHVSVAHTANAVITAASQGTAVGVDIERWQRSTVFMRRVARRVFSDQEVAVLDQTPDAEFPDRFLTAWTVKEAVGKALGVGVAPALTGVVVELGSSTPALSTVLIGPPAQSWSIRTLAAPGGDERIAVALPAPQMTLAPVTQWRLEDFRPSP